MGSFAAILLLLTIALKFIKNKSLRPHLINAKRIADFLLLRTYDGYLILFMSSFFLQFYNKTYDWRVYISIVASFILLSFWFLHICLTISDLQKRHEVLRRINSEIAQSN
jgi:threonine/homoserine/homoserine lactone efflux protein